MRITIETITPEIAANMLKGDNRPLSIRVVDKYAVDMKEGKFATTHQGIAIGKNGDLLDGFHRLNAIIKSGVTLQLPVAYDVDNSLFSSIDIGKPRSPYDCLSINGFKGDAAKSAATAVSMIINFKTNGSIHRALPVKCGGSAEFVMKFIKENPKLKDSLIYCATLRKHASLLQLSALGFLHFCIQEHHDDADEFIHKVMTGDNVSTKSVIYELREQLIRCKTKTTVINYAAMIKRVIKAYRIYTDGDSLTDNKQALNRIRQDSIVSFF
jgi:hypothetical protein